MEHTGSILDEGCTRQDTLKARFRVKSIRPLHAWPVRSTATLQGGDIQVTVGPGGILILEIQPET